MTSGQPGKYVYCKIENKQIATFIQVKTETTD